MVDPVGDNSLNRLRPGRASRGQFRAARRGMGTEANDQLERDVQLDDLRVRSLRIPRRQMKEEE